MFLRLALWSAIVLLASCAATNTPQPEKELVTLSNKCECGVFQTPPSNDDAKPLIAKSPVFPLDCNEEGQNTCAKMCVALAEASRDKAGNVVCEVAGKTQEPLLPVVFARICNETTWKDTGLKSKKAICCKGSLPVDCNPNKSRPKRENTDEKKDGGHAHDESCDHKEEKKD